MGKLNVSRFRKGKIKFGIDIPITVKEAISLDESNGNTLWQDAIKIEMNNSRVAFKLCEKGEKYPVGTTKLLAI